MTKEKCRECNIKYSFLQAMNMFVSAVLSAFIVPLLQSQKFSPWEIGILIAVKCGSTILFSMFYASIADKVAEYISTKSFICFFCVSGIIVTLIHLYISMNFVRGIIIFIGYGATFSCIGAFADSLSSQYTSRNIKINYAFARSMGSLFWAFAGLILGYLTSNFSTNAILWLQIEALLLCLVVAVIMPEPNKIRAEQIIEKKKIENTSTIIGMLVNNSFYSFFLLACFFLMTGVNLTMSYMAYTVEGVGGSNFDLGMNEFILGIFEIFVGFYFSWFLRKLGTKKLLILAMAGMVTRVGMLVIAQNMFMVYVAQVFEMIGCMLWAGNVQLVQDEISQNDRVKGQAMVTSVQTGFSALAASVLGGYLLDMFHDVFYIHICAFLLGIFGITIFMVAIVVNEKERRYDRAID